MSTTTNDENEEISSDEISRKYKQLTVPRVSMKIWNAKFAKRFCFPQDQMPQWEQIIHKEKKRILREEQLNEKRIVEINQLNRRVYIHLDELCDRNLGRLVLPVLFKISSFVYTREDLANLLQMLNSDGFPTQIISLTEWEMCINRPYAFYSGPLGLQRQYAYLAPICVSETIPIDEDNWNTFFFMIRCDDVDDDVVESTANEEASVSDIEDEF